jgi:hypothetical protein
MRGHAQCGAPDGRDLHLRGVNWARAYFQIQLNRRALYSSDETDDPHFWVLVTRNRRGRLDPTNPDPSGHIPIKAIAA